MSKKNRIKSKEKRKLGAFLHFVQGGKCYLCGFDVACPSAWPVGRFCDSMPTLDHVVPLAAGGTNAQTNQALSHYSCNQAKGLSCASESQISVAKQNANAVLFVRSVRMLASIATKR